MSRTQNTERTKSQYCLFNVNWSGAKRLKGIKLPFHSLPKIWSYIFYVDKNWKPISPKFLPHRHPHWLAIDANYKYRHRQRYTKTSHILIHVIMYVCMYVCMHVCMYVCMYIYIHMCVCVCVCVCVCNKYCNIVDLESVCLDHPPVSASQILELY